MPLEVLSKAIEDHPITGLEYETVTRTSIFGEQKLKLTALANVEASIDHVFNWLQSKNRDAAEIEKLAPYFGVIWPSATALCSYLAQPKVLQNLAGKSVVELGCGLAIPSILCSKSGARCTAVDNHPSVPGFLRINIAMNEPSHVRFIAADDLKHHVDTFDYVIASDVLYERALVDIIADMVTRLAKPSATFVLADPGRPYIQEFVHAMFRRGWKDSIEPWSVPHQGEMKDIFVIVFVR
jgi:predicted nicotinamide N-methyase